MNPTANLKATLILLLVQIFFIVPGRSQTTKLFDLGYSLIPYPQEVNAGGANISLSLTPVVVLDKNASVEDQFTANELVRGLKSDFNIDASIKAQSSPGSITLTRKGAEKRVGQEGYHLSISSDQIIIRANGAAGLFYGVQTLMQLIRKESDGIKMPEVKITDWPDIRERAAHYDTKHHQDKKEYVKGFIRDLAHYKINMLVWEWEDKLAYPSHPEIGAPGAFTIEEMQEFTRYARQYHVDIVPLVQGLGHVSFILKWPQHEDVREIAASNWEFCPLKEDSYKLLFDLWKDAIQATPGSPFIHIGSDETYELASCDACKAKAAEIGKGGLYLLFVNKAAKYLQSQGRQVMAWEPPMGWEKNESPAVGIKPQNNLILTESYGYENPQFSYAKQSRSLGYKVYAYDPNPGIEHLFLPYFYKQDDDEKITPGCLENSYEFLTAAATSGAFDGMISTSWDDSGLHNQVWMLHFVTAAAFSWNGKEPKQDEFVQSFFKDYYGPNATNMKELFQLFNDGAFYYMSTFERNVWHHGDIGKTPLPDLPRGDALEYDPFWNKAYSGMIEKSKAMEQKMNRALEIIDKNLHANVKNAYDFEVFRSIAKLIWHTTQTYDDLSQLEKLITQAHRQHFLDHQLAYDYMGKASTLIKNSLKRRETIFNELVATWEKVRLPKGLSTKDKTYFFEQDRARHFANRLPDMQYLIYDEQQLNMEEYDQKLNAYMEYYKERYLAFAQKVKAKDIPTIKLAPKN
jgi:hexosaminidase